VFRGSMAFIKGFRVGASSADESDSTSGVTDRGDDAESKMAFALLIVARALRVSCRRYKKGFVISLSGMEGLEELEGLMATAGEEGAELTSSKIFMGLGERFSCTAMPCSLLLCESVGWSLVNSSMLVRMSAVYHELQAFS
jgi:hypothetical protein